MKITGYKLKEALKLKKLELKSIYSRLTDSFYAFEGENKETPVELMDIAMKIENDIALVQTAQKYYNLNNLVKVNTLGDMHLELAIKLLGSYGRKSKLFREFSGESSNRRRSYYEEKGPKSRKADTEYQAPVINKPDALKQSMDAELVASNIKSVIAMANSKEVEINFLNDLNL